MLRALCQSGQLGPSEMVLMSGYRNKANDLVVNKQVFLKRCIMKILILYRHRIHGHHTDTLNDPFPVNDKDEEGLLKSWSDWCETRIPSERVNYWADVVLIPTFLEQDIEKPAEDGNIHRNAAGIPIITRVDLEQLAPAAVLELLKQFVSSLWCKLWL